jgi:hypothetical protein
LSQIVPEGESIRNAVKWISNECKEKKGNSINQLICLAAEKYNLSPKDEEFIRIFYSKEKTID